MTPDDDMERYVEYLIPEAENVDVGMNAWRFLIAAQVHQPLTKREGDLSLLYAYTGLGMISQEMTTEFDFVDTGTGQRESMSNSYSDEMIDVELSILI